MFSTISKTGVGALIALLLTVLKVFGFEIPGEVGGQLTESVSQIIAVVLLVWGQWQRKDLVAGIIRK